MDAEEYRRKFEAGEITEDEELIWLRNKFAGIYCDNIEKHADIKDYEDGMYYCRHCYLELREENRRLKGEYKRGHAIGMKMLDDKIREKNLLLNAENRKLREAFNAAKNYIIKTDFDPDFSPKTNRAYLKYIKAKKVLDNVNTKSI